MKATHRTCIACCIQSLRKITRPLSSNVGYERLFRTCQLLIETLHRRLSISAVTSLHSLSVVCGGWLASFANVVPTFAPEAAYGLFLNLPEGVAPWNPSKEFHSLHTGAAGVLVWNSETSAGSLFISSHPSARGWLFTINNIDELAPAPQKTKTTKGV